MGRLLFLLVIAGLGWWGYESWFASHSRAAGPEFPVDDGFLDDSFVDDGPAGGAGEPPSMPRSDAGQAAEAAGAAEDGVDRYVLALRAGDERARAGAFAALERAPFGVGRERLENAIREALEAGAPAEAVAVLGPTNRFLHSEFGRECARRVAERVRELPPEPAISASTDMLEAAMAGPIDRQQAAARATVDRIYELHRGHVHRFAFDPANAARAKRYVLRSGDSLDRVAKRFRADHGLNVEAGTLALVNRIRDPARVRVGQSLRIPIDPVRCVVHKASFLLAVYIGDAIVRLYWIAHGKDAHDTPATEFVVADKIPNPDWHFEGRVIPFGHPDNALGSYFVKFEHPSYSGFGAHGTNEPETIGTRASLGCLRLLPEDIEEFASLVPRGAKVTVFE